MRCINTFDVTSAYYNLSLQVALQSEQRGGKSLATIGPRLGIYVLGG